MKRVSFLLLLWLCALAFRAQAQTMATVSANNLKDAAGNPLNGTIYFKPSIPMRLNGTGQVLQSTVKATVTGGAFSLSLADSTQTSPLNACYIVWAKDTNDDLVLGTPASSATAPAQGYGCVQMSTSWCSNHACNFDNFAPTGPAKAIIQVGPAGPAGPSGAGAFDINGVALASNTLINLESGTGVNVTNPSSGNIQFNLGAPGANTLGGVESIAPVLHQWIDSISVGGVPHQSQPSASDISGLGTAATENVGTTSGTVAAGNDSRFGNATSLNGTSIATLSGLLKLSTGAPSAASATDVIGLWTSCTSGYLAFDGTCSEPSSGSGSGTTTLPNYLVTLTSGTLVIQAGVGATVYPSASGADVAYIYIDSSGNLDVGDSSVALACTGCTALTGISAFPAGSKPIAVWNLSGSTFTTAAQDFSRVGVPQTSTSNCVLGQTADGPLDGVNYHFFCYATNTWSRVAMTNGGW